MKHKLREFNFSCKLLFFVLFFWDRVSLGPSDWPRIHYVFQAGLELSGICLPLLGLKPCNTTILKLKQSLLLIVFTFLWGGVEDRVSLCGYDCPRTVSVDQAALKLRSACLCLLDAGIKGVHHNPDRFRWFLFRIYHMDNPDKLWNFTSQATFVCTALTVISKFPQQFLKLWALGGTKATWSCPSQQHPHSRNQLLY